MLEAYHCFHCLSHVYGPRILLKILKFLVKFSRNWIWRDWTSAFWNCSYIAQWPKYCDIIAILPNHLNIMESWLCCIVTWTLWNHGYIAESNGHGEIWHTYWEIKNALWNFKLYLIQFQILTILFVTFSIELKIPHHRCAVLSILILFKTTRPRVHVASSLEALVLPLD